jgi:hypothetical protein
MFVKIECIYRSMEYAEGNICVHSYLTQCKTNPQPPGFADYLRGTIALFTLSKQYGYTLCVDGSHPIFKYFRKHPRIISADRSSEVVELLHPHSYDVLETMFSTGNPISVMTNSFYTKEHGVQRNWGSISNECREFLQDMFSITSELQERIEYVIRSVYSIEQGQTFKAIHIRAGDRFLHHTQFDNAIYSTYYRKITHVVQQDKGSIYILLSDSSEIAKKLSENIAGVRYWDNAKTHIGDLKNNVDTALLDTLTDFFILSKASHILCDTNAGFSCSVSTIFDIPYITY